MHYFSLLRTVCNVFHNAFGRRTHSVCLYINICSGLHPTRMFINRGNHETKDMNRAYGFEGEAKHKHGEQTYKVCERVYDETIC